MTAIRFLVERRWQGLPSYSIEHDDLESTRREIKAGKAVRSEITICEFMMVNDPKIGLAGLVKRRQMALEVVR